MRSPSRWPTARRSPQRTPRSPGAPLESGHGPTSPPAAAPVAELRAAGVAATNEEAPLQRSTHQNLSRSNLSRSNLSRSNLSRSNLSRSNLSRSKIPTAGPGRRSLGKIHAHTRHFFRTSEARRRTKTPYEQLAAAARSAGLTPRAARGGGQVGGPHAVATGGAVGIAAQLELAEGRRLRIEHQQPPDQRLSVADEDLEGLVGLQHSDDAWEHAQDPGLASRGGQFVRRRFGVHAAVAGAALLGPERAGVALEPED